MALWGFNFAFIRLGLNQFPPLMMCSVRFFLAAIPAIFFVKRPRIRLELLLSYGLVMFVLQFGFLFSAIRYGMPAGLASLVMQFQIFFTVGLAVYFFKDRLTHWKVVGALISFSGLAIVAFHTEGDITALGLILTLLASFSWGIGNIVSKKIGAVSAFGLVVWGSLVAAPFLLIASLIFEGPKLIYESMKNLTPVSMLSVGYIVYMSTHVAYSLWSHFLKTYPISQIAPFTLLVPFFGFIGSMLILNETFPFWKVMASVLLVLGLAVYFIDKKKAH